MKALRHPARIGFLLMVLLPALLLAGCGRSAPANYYLLTAQTRASAVGSSPPPPAGPTIGIGPVRLEEHLDRPQIVLRSGTNRLQLADSQRWAEPLAENISSVLRDNLAQLLDSERLVLYPWERTSPPDYQIILDLLRCEKAPDGAAQLEALWSVADRSGTSLQAPRRSSYLIPPATPDPEGLVGALSEALARLSGDIAEKIREYEQMVPSPPLQQGKREAK